MKISLIRSDYEKFMKLITYLISLSLNHSDKCLPSHSSIQCACDGEIISASQNIIWVAPINHSKLQLHGRRANACIGPFLEPQCVQYSNNRYSQINNISWKMILCVSVFEHVSQRNSGLIELIHLHYADWWHSFSLVLWNDRYYENQCEPSNDNILMKWNCQELKVETLKPIML